MHLNNTSYSVGCIVITFLFWSISHMVAAKVYSSYCAPITLVGIVVSPLLSVSPHCKAALWTINATNTISNGYWVAATAWMAAKFTTMINTPNIHSG